MHSTRRLICTSLLGVAALLAQGPGFGGPEGHGGPHGGPGGPMGAVVTGAPYSATRTETHLQTLADGNKITETRTEKVYRDAQGRTRTETTMTTPSGTTRTMIRVFDPVAGFVAHLNPSDATAMKMTVHTPPAGALKTPPMPPTDANGPKVVSSESATTLNGLAVTDRVTTATIPAGAIGNAEALVETREVWISSALQVPMKMVSSDPRRGNSTMELSNIVQGAPDATLFTIPSGYTVKDAAAHRGPDGRGPGGPF